MQTGTSIVVAIAIYDGSVLGYYERKDRLRTHDYIQA